MAMLTKRTRRGDVTASLPDVLQFMQVLWAVVHGLEKTSKRMAGDLGVTGPQRLALRVIGLVPGVSAGDLATILHVHPSTLTGVLQRLVAHRWLRRVDDPGDRRRAVLRLTARGARINAARHGTVEAAVNKLLRDVSSQDRRATMRVLEGLAQHLGSPAAKGFGPTSASRPTPSRAAAGRHRMMT